MNVADTPPSGLTGKGPSPYRSPEPQVDITVSVYLRVRVGKPALVQLLPELAAPSPRYEQRSRNAHDRRKTPTDERP
jgi:hypothetical protein